MQLPLILSEILKYHTHIGLHPVYSARVDPHDIPRVLCETVHRNIVLL